jgi:GTP cyclohydrolase IA
MAVESVRRTPLGRVMASVPARPAAETTGGGRGADRAGVREILLGLGEDPDREGLLDTPARVARAYAELLAGSREDAGEHLARVFSQEQAGDDVVMLRGSGS